MLTNSFRDECNKYLNLNAQGLITDNELAEGLIFRSALEGNIDDGIAICKELRPPLYDLCRIALIRMRVANYDWLPTFFNGNLSSEAKTRVRQGIEQFDRAFDSIDLRAN